MEPLLSAAAMWLDAVGIGPWARGSALVYPVANTLHLLGLVMLVGGIGVVDLRVVGLWRTLPIAALSRALTPIAIGGLFVVAASGTILFAADGDALAGSQTFARKLVVIALVLVNAAAFRLLWRARVDNWRGSAPVAARAMAALSLALWLTVGGLGRWIAYS